MSTLLLAVSITALSLMLAFGLVQLRYRRPLQDLLDVLQAHDSNADGATIHARGAPLVTRLTREVLELQATNHRLHQQTVVDPLTGLGNRRLLEQRLEIVLPFSRRWMTSVSALMIDVDHFKNYNDCYGHQAGDECLVEIANVLRDTFRRETDIVVRLGGEEFLVVLLDASAHDATRLAEAMRGMLQAVGIPHEGSQVAEVVTVSIGVATTGIGTPLNLEDMIATADAALYACKARGRNCVISRQVGSADVPQNA